MLTIITGTPGTGKTTIAKEAAKKLGWKLINELEFCKKKKIGKLKGKEIEVPLGKLEKELKKEIKKSKNLILEGHLLCELKLPADLIVVLRTNAKALEKRLRMKGYAELKILDNLFCEKTNYCRQKAVQNYGNERVLELENGKGIKEIAQRIVKETNKLNGALSK